MAEGKAFEFCFKWTLQCGKFTYYDACIVFDCASCAGKGSDSSQYDSCYTETTSREKSDTRILVQKYRTQNWSSTCTNVYATMNLDLTGFPDSTNLQGNRYFL